MLSANKTNMIKAIGKIEGYKNDVKMLHSMIDGAPSWRPGSVLKKQCEKIMMMIDDLKSRFDRKLVVTIVGPCGSGKSTLLNALAGVDDFSPTGHHRPTTRNIVVFGRDKKDARGFYEAAGSDKLKVRSSRGAKSLEHVILVDTPDTDSIEHGKHIPILNKIITLSDILICIFDSENPKRRDHVDFLTSYVQMFNGDSLIAVINKCDRQDEKELKDKIVPDFMKFIHTAWNKPVQDVLCISARSHLKNPGWVESAEPKHGFDQFPILKQLIFGTFNSPGFIVDSRLKNAESFKNFIFAETVVQIKKDAERLKSAQEAIMEAEKSALARFLFNFKNNNAEKMFGLNVLLYQKLAHRWLGPVGWIIAMWARILIFTTGIFSMIRYANPFHRLSSMFSSLKNFKELKATVARTDKNDSIDAALRNYRISIMEQWPDIAELLVKCRFDPKVRKVENILQYNDTLHNDLSRLWIHSLDDSIDKISRKLSGIFIQLIFNLPVIGIMGYAGWIIAYDFFKGNYLSSGYFLHAFFTIAIVLFLSFFILQGWVRLISGSDRLTLGAFEQVKKEVEQFQPLSDNPVGLQINNLIELIRFANTAIARE